MNSECPLAVFTPLVGTPSETFVRRHIEFLLPRKTAVIADVVYSPDDGAAWSFSGPLLNSRQPPTTANRVIGGISRMIGLQDNHLISSVTQFLRTHKVRVLMGEYLDQSLVWLQLAKKLGVRAFGHAHGYDISQQLQNERWRSEYLRYNELDGVITPSAISRQRLIEVGISASKIHVVPYGIDVPSDAPRRDQSHPDKIICLAVGRMTAKKAPILLLDSFRRAADEDSRLFLNYIGAGELFASALQFVQTFNLQDRVAFFGALTNDKVLFHMKEANIFLQHSVICPVTGDEEGVPVAILEAMACGLPVVSTLHSGIPEAVLDGETGFLVSEGNTQAMSKRILELAKDQKLREKLGQSGWRRAENYFSWTNERDRLLNILGLAPSEN
jgi:colanic acid/amylovoran biosynthesis glycosyltransferase